MDSDKEIACHECHKTTKARHACRERWIAALVPVEHKCYHVKGLEGHSHWTYSIRWKCSECCVKAIGPWFAGVVNLTFK